MKKIVVGNWKMHGDAAMARPLVQAISARAAETPSAQVILCPPATLAAQVGQWCGKAVGLGGQDCAAQAEGAYTGDISAAMLKDAGCTHVIVGHSERRSLHHESSADVRAKAEAAIKAGLIPIVCVGESQVEREAGKAEPVVGEQLRQSLPDAAASGKFMLAYEPVWAIGSGKTPTEDDIARMHAHILAVAAQRTGLAPERISVLYGGSVKAANAAEIMAVPAVAGVLVGGASLKAEEFGKIIAAAAAKKG